MLHLGCCSLDLRRCGSWRTVNGVDAFDSKYAFVLVWEDLDELRLRVGPVLKDPCGTWTAGVVAMALQKSTNLSYVCFALEGFQVDAGFVAAPRREIALIVEYKSAASTHTCCKVAAGSAKHYDGA